MTPSFLHSCTPCNLPAGEAGSWTDSLPAQGQTAWADPACDSRGNMTTVPSPAGPDQIYAWTYNASWQLLESRRAAGVSRTGQPLSEPAAASAVHEQYVWSERYLDAPILRDRDLDPETGDLGRSGSGLDERIYYLTDAHMNVTAVVDTSGAVVERYGYDPPSSAGGGLRRAGPYGRATILDGATGGQTDWAVDADQSSDVANEVLWCGYLRDAETGLYHVRRRTYHPLLGRWVQRDPIGYVDGMSLYEYCGSAAIMLADASGLYHGFNWVFPQRYGKLQAAAQEALEVARVFPGVLLEDMCSGRTGVAALGTIDHYLGGLNPFGGGPDFIGIARTLAPESVTAEDEVAYEGGGTWGDAGAVTANIMMGVKGAVSLVKGGVSLAGSIGKVDLILNAGGTLAATITASAEGAGAMATVCYAGLNLLDLKNDLTGEPTTGDAYDPGTEKTCPRQMGSDIEKKLRQFEKKSLRDQKSIYEKLRKTYEEHLRKYGQQAGQTTGETNRMERELQEMRRILRGRGQDVD